LNQILDTWCNFTLWNHKLIRIDLRIFTLLKSELCTYHLSTNNVSLGLKESHFRCCHQSILNLSNSGIDIVCPEIPCTSISSRMHGMWNKVRSSILKDRVYPCERSSCFNFLEHDLSWEVLVTKSFHNSFQISRAIQNGPVLANNASHSSYPNQ